MGKVKLSRYKFRIVEEYIKKYVLQRIDGIFMREMKKQ